MPVPGWLRDVTPAGGPLRARAEFTLCDNAEGTGNLAFEADVTVRDLDGLTLEREFVVARGVRP